VSAAPDATVLVLGTDSPLLSDVQDRLLRESLMRGILAAGMKIVPVMDLERSIQLEGFNVRTVSPSRIPFLAETFGAGFCVRGSLGGKGRADIYTLIIDDIASGKRYAADLPILKGESFQVYCPGLVKRIVGKLEEIMAGIGGGK
jgi:hypothetical protein